GGFFEEDEDETIALTGDELDNILNTAEFIEEQGQPTDFEDSELDLDLSSLEEEASQASVTDEEIEDNIVELDSSDEDFTFDLPDSGAEAIESSSADFSMEEDTGSLDQSAENQSSQDQLGGESEPFGASHEEVDALANMDIDSELADIDELDEAGSETAAVADLHESDESASATGAEREPEAYAEPESVLELEPEAEPAEAGHAAEDTPPAEAGQATEELPESLREEIRSVLGYMDQLLESLPEEKIREFANSEHFEVYKRLFEELELEP
ncbi:MAG: hypothetical protein ACOCZ9_02670, partial [Spirochaetota bacterium]